MISTRIIAFDFDGVLADSVPIKDAACQYLFRHHDREIQVAALTVWNRLKGVFRRERIQAVYQEVLGITLDERTLAEQLRQFESQAVEQTVAAPWIAGVRAFLEEGWQYPLYVVSASPQEEVREVIMRRGMVQYFKEVYGGPVKKTELLAQILQQEGLQQEGLQQEACVPQSLLFIGDSISDYLAAAAVGTAFLGVVAAGNNNVFPEKVVTVPDLTQLDAFLVFAENAENAENAEKMAKNCAKC